MMLPPIAAWHVFLLVKLALLWSINAPHAFQDTLQKQTTLADYAFKDAILAKTVIFAMFVTATITIPKIPTTFVYVLTVIL